MFKSVLWTQKCSLLFGLCNEQMTYSDTFTSCFKCRLQLKCEIRKADTRSAQSGFSGDGEKEKASFVYEKTVLLRAEQNITDDVDWKVCIRLKMFDSLSAGV